MRPDDAVKVVTVKGIKHVDTKACDAATYLQPKSNAGTSWL